VEHERGAPAPVPNVLAGRYASPAMVDVWRPEGRVRLERELWIAVLRAQAELGVGVPDGAIAAYEAVVDQVDLASIAARERVTKHDVKARIEEFCALAGHEVIHRGMTSRDVTENVEQLQVRRSLELVRDRLVAALALLAERAVEYRDTVVVGRSHNQPAQPTTLGKRLANVGEELLLGHERIVGLLERQPLRGLKGPVGTQADLVALLGDEERVAQLERAVAQHLGFARGLDAVGQVYPRSLDLDVVSALVQVASAPASFANTVRLMSGDGLVTEGFAEGQVGSSAMPHKMNPRSCERIVGFKRILDGHLVMIAGVAGDQWFEGDVSCSVVRRVVLPDAFLALDGLFETFLTVLADFAAFPAVIERELARHLPFLATTRVLTAAVAAGIGREVAHEVVREHSLAVAAALREGRDDDLFARLAADPRLPLPAGALQRLLDTAGEMTGTAGAQVDRFAARVATLRAADPTAAAYRPKGIL
jgi:adenylosuccinate lyase